MVAPLKHGPWKLSDINDVPKNGLKVFSCFHCGGGSTMGYKLAGYDVLGGVEIDPEMMNIYRANHNPKHSYLMGVQQFKNIPDEKLPPELFNLDILDGSPPCSSFSMAGSREKAWGEKKKFREGQAEQVLDDLFFDFIDIAKKLQPKVVVAENVKGLIQGNAKGYVKEIFQGFRSAGYDVQLFLLNAATMGVPQKRERTFFIANKLNKKIKLNFNEKILNANDLISELIGEKITDEQKKWWSICEPGKPFSSIHPKKHWFNSFKMPLKGPINTLAAATGNAGPYLIKYPNRPNQIGFCRLQSFPDDYNFCNQKAQYVCGMSVPPYMMQRVAIEIHKQFFNSVMK